MTRRRGFTLVEVMMTSVLGALIVGATGGLMVFATKRAQHAYSENAVVTQVLQLSAEMESTISSAVGCSVQTNAFGSSIKCIMPAQSRDGDNDGKADDWDATTISSAGTEKYGNGVRVWYYWADATGAFGSAGPKPQFYRAYRNDDSSPTAGDIDLRFSRLYNATGSRWSLIDTVTFSESPTTKLFNFTITASKLISQERTAGGTTGSDMRDFRISRSVMAQEWRK